MDDSQKKKKFITNTEIDKVAYSEAPSDSYRDIGAGVAEDHWPMMIKAVMDAKKNTEGSFCVEFFFKQERLFINTTHMIPVTRATCPTPRYFNHGTGLDDPKQRSMRRIDTG